VPTSLPVKAQKDRYANAVWQVTVRALHEIFEADRAGKTARIAQRGRTDGIQRAHQGHHCDPCK
jgi:restriction system protein